MSISQWHAMQAGLTVLEEVQAMTWDEFKRLHGIDVTA